MNVGAVTNLVGLVITTTIIPFFIYIILKIFLFLELNHITDYRQLFPAQHNLSPVAFSSITECCGRCMIHPLIPPFGGVGARKSNILFCKWTRWGNLGSCFSRFV